MMNVGQELADLRRTVAQLVAASDWSAVPVFTAVRLVPIPAGGAEPTELAPNRPDRLRLRVQVQSVGPISIAESPEVAVKGGWRLILDGPPFVDDWPVAARGPWYGWAAAASVAVVTETIRLR